jgi:Ca2+/H+ antiporter, TMEM165/GDT1 family
LTVFFISFLTVFLAELGDKTQLVTLTLSSRYSPRQVLTGALGALAAITGLAVVLGDFLAGLLPQSVILAGSGILFLAVGIGMLLKKDETADVSTAPAGGVAVKTFAMVFLAELGDKTQLAAIALTATYGAPLAVFLGAMSGLAANHGAAAFFGARFLARLPRRTVSVASALVFLVFGMVFLIGFLS